VADREPLAIRELLELLEPEAFRVALIRVSRAAVLVLELGAPADLPELLVILEPLAIPVPATKRITSRSSLRGAIHA